MDISTLSIFYEKIIKTHKLEDFFEVILAELYKIFEIKSYLCYIIPNSRGTTLNNFKVVNSNFGQEENKILEVLEEEGIINWVLEEPKIRVIPEEIVYNNEIYNLCAFTLVNVDRPLGGIFFISKFQDLTEEIESGLNYKAYLSSIVLDNILLSLREKKYLKRQEELINVGNKIFKTLEPNKILKSLLDFLKRHFKFDKVAIFIKNIEVDYFENIEIDDEILLKLDSLEYSKIAKYFSPFFKQYNEGSIFIDSFLNEYLISNVLTIKYQIAELEIYILLAFKTSYNMNEDELSWLKVVLDYFLTSFQNSYLFQKTEKIKQLLELNQKELFKASKLVAVGDLASSVAHEINTPLQIILGRMELMLLKSEDCNVKKDILIIKEETERMIGLVKSLLDLAATNYDEQKFEEISINSVILEVLEFIKKQFEISQIDIETLGFDREYYIYGAKPLLKQVFLNLFINSKQALKQVEREKKLIKIILNEDKENNNVLIIVEDNGPGIPDEIKDKIFNRYVTYNKPKEGHGIGLTIVKNFIEKHGGKIKVESKTGEFTRFYIYLPLNK